MAGVASAQTVGDWTSTADGDWSDAANWGGGPVPGLTLPGVSPNDTANINSNIGGTRTITLDGALTTPNQVFLGTLSYGDSNRSNAFIITGGTLTMTTDVSAGTSDGLAATIKADGGGAIGYSGNNSDRIDALLELADADGLVINRFANLSLRGGISGTTDFGGEITLTERGIVLQQSVITGVDTITIDEGEWRVDTNNNTGRPNDLGSVTTVNVSDMDATADDRRVWDTIFFYRALGDGTNPIIHSQNINLQGDAQFRVQNSNSNAGGAAQEGNNQTFTGILNVTNGNNLLRTDRDNNGNAESRQVFHEGAITGDGDLAVIGSAASYFSADNTLSGNLTIISQSDEDGGNRGKVNLTGVNGAFSGVQDIYLERRGTLFLDDSAALHGSGNRINDAADLIFQNGQVRVEIQGNGAGATTETIAGIQMNGGNAAIELDLDATPQNFSLTLDSITRSAPSVLELRVEDAGSGGSALFDTHFGLQLSGVGGIAQVPVVGSTILSDGTATDTNILQGVFAGNRNNRRDRFVTLDTDGVTLRILDPVTEMQRSTTQTGDVNLFDIDGADDTQALVGIANVLDGSYVSSGQNFDWDFVPGSPDNGDPATGTRSDGAGDAFITTDVSVNAMRLGMGAGGNDRGRSINLINGSTLTIDSGSILAGRTSAGGDFDASYSSNARFLGGTIDFGSNEAIIHNDSNRNLFFYSALTGSGGLTKSGPGTVYLSGDNSGLTGNLNLLDATLVAEGNRSLDGFSEIRRTGDGALFLEDNIVTPADLDIYGGVSVGSSRILRGNNSNTVFQGDIIIEQIDSTGQNRFFQTRIDVNNNATLGLTGNIYRSADSLAAQTSDLYQEDAPRVSFDGSGAGVINLLGVFQDQASGVQPNLPGGANPNRIDNGSPVNPVSEENRVLMLEIEGNNALNVNVFNQWNTSGRIELVQGILRFEGDANESFWSDDAFGFSNFGLGVNGFRLINTGTGANNGAAFFLTEDGQTFNAKQWTVQSDNTNTIDSYAIIGGAHESGTVQFGDDTLDRGSAGSNRITTNRALTFYQAAGGTMVVNQSVRDGGGSDDRGMIVGIGRGTKVLQQYRGAGGGDNGVNDSENNQIDRGIWARGGDFIFNFDNGSTSGTIRNLTETTAGLRFNGGNIVMQGDPTSGTTKTFLSTSSLGGNIIGSGVQRGGSELAVVTQGANLNITVGDPSVAFERDVGGALNIVEDGSGGGTPNLILQDDGTFFTVGSADGTFDSFIGGWASYGTSRGQAEGWAGLDDDFQVGLFSGTTDNVFASATETRITLDPNSAGYTTNTLLIDAPLLTVTDSGVATIEGGGILKTTDSTGTTTFAGGGTLTAGAGNELVVHNYSTDDLIFDSAITDNGSPVSLTIIGPNDGVAGRVQLNGANLHTGTNYIGGAVDITTGGDGAFGAVPGAFTDGNIYGNGGTIYTSADQTLNDFRGFVIGGDGLTFDVDGENTELNLATSSATADVNMIRADTNVFDNIDLPSNPFSGDLIKTGSGSLVIGHDTDGSEAGLQNTYSGLTDIREGSLIFLGRVSDTNPDDIQPLGTNLGWEDGTIIRGGATLDIGLRRGSSGFRNTQNVYEWLTLENGATLKKDDTSVQFRGQTRIDGTVTFDLGRREMVFTDGGVLQSVDPSTMDTIIVTQTRRSANDANLRIAENAPNLNAQFVIVDGTVEFVGQGTPWGSSNAEVLIGRTDLGGPGSDLPGVGDGDEVGVYFRSEGDFTNTVSFPNDLRYRDNGGLNNQTKRLGIRYFDHNDVFNLDGDLYIDDMSGDDITIIARDDNTSDSNANPNGNEIGYFNLNGQILGDNSNARLNFRVEQGGSNNGQNQIDEVNVVGVFSVNGDNKTQWDGDIRVGLPQGTNAFNQGGAGVGDNDKTTILRLGADASDEDNNVVMRHNGRIQTFGGTTTIGNLYADADGSFNTAVAQVPVDVFIENAHAAPIGSAPMAGTFVFHQTVDHEFNGVFRDGRPFEWDPSVTPAALNIVKGGNATFTLINANQHTGTTEVRGGTLALNHSAADSMLSDTAALIFNGGTVDLAGTFAYDEVVGSTTILGGANRITQTGGTSTLQLNNLTHTNGTLDLSADAIASTDTLNTNGILGNWITVNGVWATNSTDGPDGPITALTTFSDITRLDGIINDAPAANARIIDGGTTSNISLGGTGTTNLNSLLQTATAGDATVDIGGGNTLRIGTGGILQQDGAGALVFTNGSLTAGPADDTAATLLFSNLDTTGEYTQVGSVIADNGTGVVDVQVSAPSSRVLFAGNNTYTGTTEILAGVLQVGIGGAGGTLSAGDVILGAGAQLRFNRNDNISLDNTILGDDGVIRQNGSGTLTLNFDTALRGLTFEAASGTLAVNGDNNLNTTGDLVIGAFNGATGVAAVDLSNGSGTIGGLRVRTNTATPNTLTIGAGETLNVNGNVTIGYNLSGQPIDGDVRTTTVLNVVGGTGTLAVNDPGGTFQVGGQTSDGASNNATLDLSGLGTFTADLGTNGIFQVGDNDTNSNGSGNATSTVILSATSSTITAGEIRVGAGSATNAATRFLSLGEGTNILNADTIFVGSSTNRGIGEINFADATNGSVQIRGSDGSSRATLNVLRTTSGSGYNMAGTADFSGHAADLLLDTLSVGVRTGGTGEGVGSLSFDQGTLDVTNVFLGEKSGGTGSAVQSGTLNIGGGTVAIGTGGVVMATQTTDFGDSQGILNLTGGTITTAGDIVRGDHSGAGPAAATFNLDGADIDFQGNNLGDATNPIDTVTLASGVLRNVGEINGGGNFAKSTAGTLQIAGVHGTTGVLTVGGGILEVTGSSGTGGLTIANGGTLAGTGTVRSTTIVESGGSVKPGIAAGGLGGLSFTGVNAEFQAGSAAEFLLSVTPGTSDQLIGDANNTLTLTTGSTFTVTGWDGSYTAADGDMWTLLANWDSITGDFNVGSNLRASGTGGGDLDLPDLGGSGFLWDVSSFTTTGAITVVVPEPSRAVLLGFGLLTLILRRRR